MTALANFTQANRDENVEVWIEASTVIAIRGVAKYNRAGGMVVDDDMRPVLAGSEITVSSGAVFAVKELPGPVGDRLVEVMSGFYRG